MNTVFILLVVAVCGGTLFIRPAEAPAALAMCALAALPTIIILARTPEQRTFLMRLFVLALVVRIILAVVIYVGHMEEFFGGDANTYDVFGQSLVEAWHGNEYHQARYEGFVASGATAWGMIYLVAAVYEVVGANMLAVQLVNAAIGAATAIVVYHAAQTLFGNKRVSQVAAILVAFFPSLVLWSSQALKDGLIIMALALAILATLRLMEKVTATYVMVLIGCLIALFSLRFYIFYMMCAAVAGSFFLGMKSLSAQGFLQRFVAVGVIGLAFTWFGVLQSAGTQFERYANLKSIQNSREDQAAAGSGFMKDVDVGTTEGALTVIPMGLLYLMFAPFPWQFTTLRQTITLPEMLVWWICFPLLVLGLWYSLKHRLRQVSPIIIFTTMLTLAYSLFQGNVGTAYRQRSQLLVFYFIFVAVGAIIMKERAENRRYQQKLAKQELADLQAARVLARRKAADVQHGSTASV
ncbi:MAG TPA: glycosyltransferase family 39 protein [Pyrinomonadaceae bacterium]|jgi:4-amino-4-deoxy-L-arabinose transferase-like glycosyltransferase|nr:glycosyltransferase family 39 protein [Pyrinomonadaceae bacterium]